MNTVKRDGCIIKDDTKLWRGAKRGIFVRWAGEDWNKKARRNQSVRVQIEEGGKEERTLELDVGRKRCNP